MPANNLTTAERRLSGKAYADRRWALTPDADRPAATKPARDAMWRKYLDAVDPERTLPEEERNRRAAQLRSSDMTLLALWREQRKREQRTRREAGKAPVNDHGDPGAAETAADLGEPAELVTDNDR